MSRVRRNGEWSVVLFVVALLAFNPPVLSIFSVPELVFGIPTLYLYIFLAWVGVIALLAANVPGLVEPDKAPPSPPEPAAEPLSDALADDADADDADADDAGGGDAEAR